MKKLLIPIVAVVLLAAGGAAYFMFSNKPAQAAKEATYFTYALEESFITNVKNSQSLFKTSIAFKIKEGKIEEQKKYLDENGSIIRDSILFLLREKTYEELRSSGIRETLSKEITEMLNQKLEKDYIVSVYFNQYVIQ